MFRIFLFVVLVVNPLEAQTSSKPAKVETSAWEHPQWKSWLNRFASSSPLLSIRKTRPEYLHITDAHIHQVLIGNSKVSFETPLHLGKIEYKEYEIFDFVSARRFEPFDQIDYSLMDFEVDDKKALREEERSRVMRSHIIDLVTKRKEGELNLFLVGGMHAYDLFFRTFLDPDLTKKDPLYRLRDEVVYVALPIQNETKFYTENYEKFVAISRGVSFDSPTIKEKSLYIAMSFLARLYYYNNLKSGLVKKEAILEERPVKLGNLVFMDIHYLRVKEPYASMPSAQALKDIGIKKIVVAMEGWKAGKVYQLEDMKKFYRIKEGGKYSSDDLNYFKKFRSEAYKLYETNFVTDASVEAFHDKLRTYAAAGLELSFTGLEDTERF